MGATQFGLRDGFGPRGIPCSQPTRCAVPHRQNPSEPRWVTSSSSKNMSAGTARWESRSVASPECYTFYIKIFLIFYKIKYIYIYYFFLLGWSWIEFSQQCGGGMGLVLVLVSVPYQWHQPAHTELCLLNSFLPNSHLCENNTYAVVILILFFLQCIDKCKRDNNRFYISPVQRMWNLGGHFLTCISEQRKGLQ